MSNFTRAQVPADIQDPIQLKMFLLKLVEDIDIAFGARDSDPFLTEAATSAQVTSSSIESRRYELLIT